MLGRCCVTVNTSGLAVVPPGVVITIFPVFAPVGTSAVTCVSEFTVNVVAFTPPKVTLEACARLTPVMVTGVPTGPLVGVKVLIAVCTFGGRCPRRTRTAERPFSKPQTRGAAHAREGSQKVNQAVDCPTARRQRRSKRGWRTELQTGAKTGASPGGSGSFSP